MQVPAQRDHGDVLRVRVPAGQVVQAHGAADPGHPELGDRPDLDHEYPEAQPGRSTLSSVTRELHGHAGQWAGVAVRPGETTDLRSLMTTRPSGARS